MHTEGHDMGRPENVPAHPAPKLDAEHPGYETQDVSVRGIVVFLAGLSGFVAVFFFFCFVMGKAINYALAQHDGPTDKWHTNVTNPGATPRGEKREDLASNSVMEQRQLQQMTQAFPTPRLETDDGNQDIADLHAREDLLLDNYSKSADLPAGAVRIPIAVAMQLVVKHGLPQAPSTTAPDAPLMAGETKPKILAPLTDGFARTGYELTTIEAREQKNEYEHAEAKR